MTRRQDHRDEANRALQARSALRPLRQPRSLRVRTDDLGAPLEVTRETRRNSAGGPRTSSVERIEEVWRVADEWWREAPIARTYYRVILDDGGLLTLFHDDDPATPPCGVSAHLWDSAACWYEQHY